MIGKELFKENQSKLAKITGLDPAGPCFKNWSPQERLDKSDADFVSAIHTSGTLGTGFNKSISFGHVDFYPNDGYYQPQCRGKNWISENLSDLFCGESKLQRSFPSQIKDTLQEIVDFEIKYVSILNC